MNHKTLLVATIILSTSGFTSESHEYFSEPEHQVYRQEYPLFIEGCVNGQRVDIGTDGMSPYGHGSVFIKGVAVEFKYVSPEVLEAHPDKNQAYPQLKMNLTGINDEFGVSANGQYYNQNWVAVPGEKLFYYGNLRKDQVLTQEIKDNLVSEMMDTPYYLSGRSHRYSTEDPVEHLRQIINESIPIDLAVAWSRRTYCQRVPITQTQLQSIIDYYNDLNQFYYEEGHEYTWSLLSNSCGHTAHNAFGAIDIINPVKTEVTLGRGRLFNAVVPSHLFMHLFDETQPNKFPSLRELVRDEELVTTLMSQNTIPQREGVITRIIKPHGYDNPSLNELYDPEASQIGFLPVLDQISGLSRKLERIENNIESYSSLRHNLEAYLVIYRDKLQEAQRNRRLTTRVRDRISRQWIRVEIENIGQYSIEDIKQKYISYLQGKIQKINENLTRI